MPIGNTPTLALYKPFICAPRGASLGLSISQLVRDSITHEGLLWQGMPCSFKPSKSCSLQLNEGRCSQTIEWNQGSTSLLVATYVQPSKREILRICYQAKLAGRDLRVLLINCSLICVLRQETGHHSGKGAVWT